jgi:hypothetical protein
MNEDQKIEEAQYFLDKVTNPDLEHRGFSFELSAFLTAARYFKDKRDVSVHVTPVIPCCTFHIKLEDRITFGDSVSVEVRKPDGTIVPDPPQNPAREPVHARADLFDYIERFHNPRMRRRVANQDQKFSALSKPSVITG